MLYNRRIHKKAKAILEEQRYESNCLKAGVCSKCGCKLERNTDDHGFVDLSCTNCGAVYYLE